MQRMLTAILVLVGAYAVLVLTLFLMQRTLLYLPGNREASAAQAGAVGFVKWPEESAYRGYMWQPASAERADEDGSRVTLVVFHGNAGDAIDRVYYRDVLGFTGARILIAEYPGYGGRGGRPSESSVVADARDTLSRVAARWPDDALYVLGESLGAGVAAAALGEPRIAERVDGLWLITPWDSLVAVAATHYWYVPVRWLLHDRYDSVSHLEHYSKPTLIVIAEDDRIVPAEHGRRLHEELSEPKRLLVVKGAHHNDWLGAVDRLWWRDGWAYLSRDNR